MPVGFVGDWELGEMLGRGGMGIVYAANHSLIGGEFAIKMLRPELANDKSVMDRFLSEVQKARLLDHPNIVRMEIPFRVDDAIYLPMERLRGTSLADLMTAQPGPWPIERAIDLMTQSATGLGHAHGRNVLHRDVKPENLFVTNTGQVKLLDFGLAKRYGERQLTKQGMAVGTPVFMAPEILRGQPPVAQSDLYALGVIFFRLLCGRLPIPVQDSGATLAELFGPVLHAHETGLPRVSSVEPEIPEWLDELVARLLDKDPQVRPDNGADLARLLEHRRSFSEPGLPARAKADSGATSSAPPDARTSEPTNAPSSAPPGARTSDPPPEAEISSPNPLTVTGDLLPVAISSQGAVTVLTGGMSSTGAAVLPQSALQNLSGELPTPGRARGSTIPLMALTAAVVAGLFFFLMKPPDPVAPATVSTPEKATPAKQVLVSFSSEPEGAIVMVEGRKLCSKTPCSGPVAPGHRYVTMRLEGHETYDAVVEVGADATGVHAKLKPKFGTISLVAPTRKNVVVWVDGEEWGTTPVEGRRVTPGRHVVEIRDRRYKKTTMTLGIEAGEQRQVVLRPAPVPAAPSGTPKEPKVGADDGFDRIFEMPEDN